MCFEMKAFSQAELKEAADHNLSEKGNEVNTTMSGMNQQSATSICCQGKIEMRFYFPPRFHGRPSNGLSYVPKYTVNIRNPNEQWRR